MTETTGTDLVFAQAALKDRMEWARAIAGAGDLVPSGLRNRDGSPNPAKILLVAETGSMLQIHPMAAIGGIHVIEGKSTLSAGLMSALVRRAGHKLRVTKRGTVAEGTFEATAILIRADDPTFEYKATWNLERAKRAGLAGKGNWNKYFEAQCKARAISEVVREGAEDVLMGNAYTPEDLGAVMTDSGELMREDLIEDAVIVDTPEPPSRSGPASGPGRAPEQPDADHRAIADEAAAQGGRALDLESWREVWRSSTRKGILQYPLTSGELLEDVLKARGEVLAAEEDARASEEQPDTVDDAPTELPF